MTTILFVLLALAAAGGGAIAWSIRDAGERAADRQARRYPPFMSLELRDIAQRRAWKRLTPSEQRWLTEALWSR